MAEANGSSGSSTSAAAAESTVQQRNKPVMPHKECIKGILSAHKNPKVVFLKERLEKAGCQVWPGLIKGAICNAAGGYSSGHGIRVCCNHMSNEDEVTQVVIHELIHAYDDCVAKNMNWKNCAHHACSEIRANHLSGDCHYKRELFRGFMKIKGHEPECVKRRALLSLKHNPHCSDAAAKDAVEAVWDICYNDTRPFDRAP